MRRERPGTMAARIGSMLAAASLAAMLAIGCGEEAPPQLEAMTLREMLGLEPERLAELPASEHEVMVAALAEAWSHELEAPAPTAEVELESQQALAPGQPSAPPLRFVREHDAARASLGLDVQVVARVDASGMHAQIRATPVPLELLGVRAERRLAIAPLAHGEPRHSGELLLDEAWGRVELDALGGRTELEALEALEPALRRYLYQMGLGEQRARVVRAPQAPVALFYASAHRAVFVNPALLYLLEPAQPAEPDPRAALDALAAAGRFGTLEQGLAPDYIARCATAQRERCTSCFGAGADSSQAMCAPLFEPADGADPETHARDECTTLAAAQGDEGFELLCYHVEIVANLGCFYTANPTGTCGASAVPASAVEELEGLRPMLDDTFCQSGLTRCRDTRNPNSPAEDPPPTSGTDDDDDDDAGDFLSSCTECGVTVCESLSGSSCGDSGSGGGGGEGGGCEGDGLDGAGDCCEGDAVAGEPGRGGQPSMRASDGANPRSSEALLALPFVFLLGVVVFAGPARGA